MCRFLAAPGRVALLTAAVLWTATALRGDEPAGDTALRKAAVAKEQAIRRVLNENTSFDFQGVPLHDVAEFFAEKHKLQIVFDKRALDDSGVAMDTEIVQRAKDVSLRSALNLILRDHSLTYLIQNEVLSITTVDQASNTLSTVVYDVQDLLEAGLHEGEPEPLPPAQYDYDSLIDVITSQLEPTTWDEVGGPASISGIYGTLVISQTQTAHEAIEQFLANMRAVQSQRKSRPSTSNDRAGATMQPGADPNALTLRVYTVPVPLLPAASRGPVDTPALAVKQADVAALPQAAGKAPTKQREIYLPDPQYADRVAAAMSAAVEPKSWDAQGGAGVVRALPADAQGQAALVVRQTATVHRQIERFLKELQAKSILSQGGFGGGFF